MVAEPTETTYDDDAIAATIERFPIHDARGVDPLTWDFTTDPPTREENENWVATYDLHAAAADIWEEKAAAVSCNYDFGADGAKISRSQVYEQYLRIAARYRARSAPRAREMVRRDIARDPSTGAIVGVTPIVDMQTDNQVFNS